MNKKMRHLPIPIETSRVVDILDDEDVSGECMQHLLHHSEILHY